MRWPNRSRSRSRSRSAFALNALLDDGVPVFEEYYSTKEQWPEASLERRKAILEKLKA